jgi:hypothetical protein
MTTDQRFTLIITGLSFLFVLMSAIFALLWRTGSKTGQTLTEVRNAVDDIRNCQNALDRHIQWHIDRNRR